MSMKTNTNLSEVGNRGVQIVAGELRQRGYAPTIMPNHNIGFDISCTTPPSATSPGAASMGALSADFEVEVKSSTSAGTQVPMQRTTHLECELRNRFYVIVKNRKNGKSDFFIMTHEEIQKAWDKMPRIRANGDPYVIRSTGYIDWKHIQPHQNRWDKLPA